jgi:hypothetical protein
MKRGESESKIKRGTLKKKKKLHFFFLIPIPISPFPSIPDRIIPKRQRNLAQQRSRVTKRLDLKILKAVGSGAFGVLKKHKHRDQYQVKERQTPSSESGETSSYRTTIETVAKAKIFETVSHENKKKGNPCILSC